MNERLCPITGELLPVTDPGRIVSQTACNRLRVATSDLTGLMGVIDALIAGEGHTHTHTAAEAWRERERAFSKSLGFGDGITEPIASLDDMLTPILEAA